MAAGAWKHLPCQKRRWGAWALLSARSTDNLAICCLFIFEIHLFSQRAEYALINILVLHGIYLLLNSSLSPRKVCSTFEMHKLVTTLKSLIVSLFTLDDARFHSAYNICMNGPSNRNLFCITIMFLRIYQLWPKLHSSGGKIDKKLRPATFWGEKSQYLTFVYFGTT